MRRAFAKSFFSAGAVAFLALIPASGAFSEDARSKSSQIVASNADSAPPATENLNTVPVDEFSSRNIAGPDSGLVRRLMAARPNEDLVICVAGCFSGRDRVVYAQPTDKATAARKPASLSGLDKQSMNGPSDGTGGSIAMSLRPSQ
jgi:hypothetical protein